MLTILEFVARLAQSDLLSLDDVDKVRRATCGTVEEILQGLLDRRQLTRYQADALRRGDGEPLVLGNYVLLEEIGSGGMGRVFQARHRFMNRIVALKLIRTELLTGNEAVTRFRREVQAVARLSHPNLVVAYDAGEAAGKHFLAMEYCAGLTLSQLVRRVGALPAGQACEYIRQAALGLQHVHELGLVHRDIKPSNLMVVNGQVKILDLGLARLREMASPAGESVLGTESGVMIGTPDFVAPEQARDSRSVDIRADIYSLGYTLYFALSGLVPFPGGTSFEKMLRHQTEEPHPLDNLCPDLPLGVLGVLRQMTAKDPARRFETPALVAAALAPLANAVESRPEMAAPEHDFSTAEPRPTLGPVPSLPPASAVPRRAAVAAEIEGGPDDVTVRGAPGDSVAPAASPPALSTINPGKRKRRVFIPAFVVGAALVILLSAVAVEGVRRRFAGMPDAPHPGKAPGNGLSSADKLGEWPLVRRFGSQAANVNAIAFTHDDRLLAVAYGTEDVDKPGVVQLWSVADGQVKQALENHNAAVRCLACGPGPSHGHVLAAGTGKMNTDVAGEVRLWNVDSGALLVTISGFPKGVNALAISPQGSWLASAGGRDDKTVKIWDLKALLEGGQSVAEHQGHPALKQTLQTTDWIGSLEFSPSGDTLLAGSGQELWRWRVADWSKQRELKLPRTGGNVMRAIWSRDGKRLAAITTVHGLPEPTEASLVVWNVDDLGTPLVALSYWPSLGGAAFLADPNLLVAGDQGGDVSLWNLTTKKQVWKQSSAANWVWGLALAHRGDLLATNGNDNSISLWRITGE